MSPIFDTWGTNEELEDHIRCAAYTAKEDGLIFQGMYWLHVVRELQRIDSWLEDYDVVHLQQKCAEMYHEKRFV